MKARKSIDLFRSQPTIAEEDKVFNMNLMSSLVNAVPEKCKFLVEHEILSKNVLVKKEVILRVYILTLEKLANRDEGLFEGGEQGISDPYVKVYLNNDDKENVVQGTENDHIDDQKDVAWCKHYE